MSQPSSSESSPEHNLTDMGEFVDQGFADGTGLFIFNSATVQETVKVEPQYEDDEDADSEDELDHPALKRFRLQNQEDELRYR